MPRRAGDARVAVAGAGATLSARVADSATMPAPPRVTFDRDGVLADGERISHLVLQAMRAEHGAPAAATPEAGVDE